MTTTNATQPATPPPTKTWAQLVQAVNRANKRYLAAKAERDALLAALVAINARISGDYSNPTLVAFGPLGLKEDDIADIARAAIAKASGGGK